MYKCTREVSKIWLITYCTFQCIFSNSWKSHLLRDKQRGHTVQNHWDLIEGSPDIKKTEYTEAYGTDNLKHPFSSESQSVLVTKMLVKKSLTTSLERLHRTPEAWMTLGAWIWKGHLLRALDRLVWNTYTLFHWLPVHHYDWRWQDDTKKQNPFVQLSDSQIYFVSKV